MELTKEDYLNSLKSWVKYSPWLLDGYCDEQGRCWFEIMGKWKLIKPEEAYNTITCLPTHINPFNSIEPVEELSHYASLAVDFVLGYSRN